MIRYPVSGPYTASIISTPTNLDKEATAPPIPKFDPVAVAKELNLDPVDVILAKVEVTYTVTVDTQPFTIRNSGTNDSNATLTIFYDNITTDGPGIGLDVAPSEFGFTNYTGAFDIKHGEFVPVDPPLQTRKITKSSTDVNSFVVGSGSSEFDLLLSSNVFSEFRETNGSTGETPKTTLISLAAEVSYFFNDPNPGGDPIPEPTSVLALGVLGLGLGALGKKQKL
jgi:hypothetical protein